MTTEGLRGMTNTVAAPGTVDEAGALIARAERADGTSPVSDQALLAAAQGQRQLLLFSEPGRAAGATEGTGSAPIAVGIVGQGELDLVVDPDERRRGVGTLALRELMRTAAADGGADAQLLAWAHGENPAAEALLAGAGFAPVRSLYRMALDPALLPEHTDPFAVEFPGGLVLRAFDGERAATAALPSDAERWVRANAAAFASHPEQGRITLSDFELMRSEPWFAADDLLLLAEPDAAALAGFTWVKTLRSDDAAETELYAIGVVPDHAGRGLGRGLLDATLARMAAHSPAAVSLYVDGENERAVRMYEAAGFTVASRSRQWRANSSSPQPA